MGTWKTRAAAGAAAAALVAGVGGVVATVPASGAPVVHHRSFIAKQISEHQLGQRDFVAAEVERHDGRVIGTDALTGHFDFKTGTARIYVAVAWKGGALIIRGHATETAPFVGRIVRGTGKYAGAQGTVTTRDLAHNRTAVKVAYTLP
jgi:glutamate synthase domain-containing protein 3